ncbi:phospholipase A1-IIgamma-like [Corylus avellana]|uniref:phospholipase A1-IIgamma-like n=1 Tax=Corylus avellana TaxID=13451 RepID=UPI00286ACD0B|nr:phospholipase A1-IIgamma-like [Corylus avellana]
MSNIATKWRALSGEEDWEGLLDPLDIDLRRLIIHYGERVQAVYDAFIGEEKSKNCGLSRYTKRHLFGKVGLAKGNQYNYDVTKYFYATTDVSSNRGNMKKSKSVEASAGDSNWIGYVAVSTNIESGLLGRRDILICWRGTQGLAEWVMNMEFDLVSASPILGKKHDPKVHSGWYSMYTTARAGSTYNCTSCREQVLNEVRRQVDSYKDEEVSITVTGHSLGAAMATMNAVDIVYNGYNMPSGPRTNEPIKACLVTVFVFGVPRIGDEGFLKVFSDLKNLHVLRINNLPGDVVPSLPPTVPLLFPYADVGEELIIDTRKSPYLKNLVIDSNAHNLEVYLHGVAGTHGEDGEFKLEVNREVALVNKTSDALKNELLVLDHWWTTKNKSMTQNDDGSWVLMDHESDDIIIL